MNETTDAVPVFSPQPPKTSRLAIASFVMGLASISGYWPLMFLPAIICGIMALVKINRSNGALKGRGFAITGIVIPSVIFFVLAAILPGLYRIRNRIVCGSNLSGIGMALSVYTAIDNNGNVPDGEGWCDILVTKVDTHPKNFICISDDTVNGESSYAMNIHAAGRLLDALPPDMVLLFETNAGREPGKRTYPIENRLFFELLEKERIGKIKKKHVHQHRWNQVGGPEILTTDNHRGEGCNILFVDGRTAFIPAEEIDNLRWTP